MVEIESIDVESLVVNEPEPYKTEWGCQPATTWDCDCTEKCSESCPIVCK